MKRNIVRIDEDKCNGCGLCVNACHEGALRLINGKARLISESYCDGLGACLPECPTGAITIEEREAEAFNEEAVKANMEKHNHPGEQQEAVKSAACGCPGLRAKVIERTPSSPSNRVYGTAREMPVSQLHQWPCQIKLVSPQAPFFEGAHLLVAADCTAYAYARIHEDFMRNKITLIGCPKLDDVDYTEKLAAIIAYNDVKSLTVLRMEVPCCGGLANAAKNALIKSGKMIPWNIITISTDGEILDN